MTGIRFNIRQRKNKKNKKGSGAGQNENRASAPARGADGIASPAAALVACIPCPALVVDGNRKISALNDPLCAAFGVRAEFYHIGEDFADFARRMSLSGSPGLLAVGDLLTSEKAPRNTEIVARNGTVYEARACRTADDKTLITLAEPSPSDNSAAVEQSQSVIENMPGAALSVVRQPDGAVRCLFANTLALELLGLGLREITGSDFDFRQVIAEKHLPEFEQSLERCAEKSDSFDMELQVENAASGRRWIRCRATASRSTDGALIIYLRLTDIEEQRRATEDRQRLQTLLDLVVDNIPLMINLKDARDRTIVVANRAFEDMVGQPRRDILGQKHIPLFSEWRRGGGQECYDRLMKTRQPVDFPEITVDAPNKGRRLLKARKYPLLDPAGEVNYILSITEDITERRKAEDALRHSEQRLIDAIESLTDGVALFDSDDRLVMCNKRYRTMWPGNQTIAVPGVSLEALVRNYLEGAASHGQTIDVDTEVKATLDRHKFSHSSRDIRVFDGRWFQVTNHPTADGGYAITCTDVTALKEREESLRKASRQAILAKETAEGANRSKSDFLANMSHELRTPLNAVIGFSEIIKEALLGDDSIEPYRGYAQDIHDSGCHLLSLINDILDMSKIEAGKLELFEEDIDLHDAIEASLRLVTERAHRNSVSLSTDIPDDLPKLKGDLRKFKQIAINLLSNAVKFTRSGGCVSTRLYVGDNGNLYLRIADTGIGISEDQIEKVLEPFGQAEAGLNRQYEGTGLGLSLTKSLAELHGGRIEIQSATKGPDKGTTVTVIFPKHRVVN